ncbi:MAG: hypothetical protein KAH01_04490, partial [Caldisericia bacterium]|nr:hypothetical protein [Caldisericia bacterium]
DPITLIDPSGNSPENTGNPPRMSGPNASPSYDPCYLPEVTTQDLAEGLDPIANRHLNEMNDACNYTMTRYFEPSGDMVDELGTGGKTINIDNGKYTVTYGFDKDGKFTVKVRDSNGKETPESRMIQSSLREALGRLNDEKFFEGFDDDDYKNFMDGFINEFNDYAKKNFKNYKRVVKYDNRFGGSKALGTFVKHSLLGYAIKTRMQKYKAPWYLSRKWTEDLNQFDMDIGFWTSFWIEASGLEIDLFRDGDSTTVTDSTVLSGLDLANIAKAMMLQESIMGNADGWDEYDDDLNIGLMQIHQAGLDDEGQSHWSMDSTSYAPFANSISDGFKDILKGSNSAYLDSFINVGIGIGELFAKLTVFTKYPYKSGKRNAPTYNQWLIAVQAYNGAESGWNNRGPYAGLIQSIFEKGVKVVSWKMFTWHIRVFTP